MFTFVVRKIFRGTRQCHAYSFQWYINSITASDRHTKPRQQFLLKASQHLVQVIFGGLAPLWANQALRDLKFISFLYLGLISMVFILNSWMRQWECPHPRSKSNHRYIHNPANLSCQNSTTKEMGQFSSNQFEYATI